MPSLLIKTNVGSLGIKTPEDKRVIDPATDMTWKGMTRLTPSGTGTSGGPGTPNYSSAVIAIRYVGGQRRLLTVMFQQNPGTSPTREFADLVEYDFPPASSYYTGSDPALSTPLVETRRWAAADWTVFDSTSQWQTGNGVEVGGLYWDEAQGVLWYQLYGYYYTGNMPFLGATQLLDTVTTGSYRAVGAKYGPWWYRTSSYPAGSPYWKSICNHIVPIPDYAQNDMGGRKVMFGATSGAVGGEGNIGVGLHAFSDFPPLTDSANTVIPLGFRVADFTNESTVSPSNCRRDNDYYYVQTGGSGLYDPSGQIGYWNMTLDQVNTSVWVHTDTKHGIVMFGRKVTGATWYGANPLSAGSSDDGIEHTDPTSGPAAGGGYRAEGWHGAVRIYDPEHVREVGRGERSPYADGMRPMEPVLDWRDLWPNIPETAKISEEGTDNRKAAQIIAQTGYWDATAGELIWGHSQSYAYAPTFQVFSIS